VINTFVIVWRESFEAMLLVGILISSLKRNKSWEFGQKYIVWGVCSGVLLAVALALGIVFATSELQGAALEHFQTAMLFVAAGLIVHMCLWMKKHSKEIKKDIDKTLLNKHSETPLQGQKSVSNSYLGLSLICALAVGREGMETVLFLYGSTLEAAESGQLVPLIAAGLFGFVLAFATGGIVSKGLGKFGFKWFFRLSSGFLLLMAGSFVIKATLRLEQAQLLPSLVSRLWDTSQIFSDSSFLAKFLSMFTGYVSAPSLMLVLVYVTFWVGYAALYKLVNRVTFGF
jgi:high-affinity iron transporter